MTNSKKGKAEPKDDDVPVFKRRIETLKLDGYNDTFLKVFYRILDKLTRRTAEKGR